MGKYLEITSVQLKHNVWKHLLISAGLLAASPLILGISNLDAAESAKVLETYVALIGIILFVPVFLPEQNRDLWELVKAKYTNITSVYLIRIGFSFLESALLVLVYISVMHSGNCEMETGRYFFGTMAEILAFGGLGIFAYTVSDNLIVGYMIPLGYYIAATGAGYKYLGKLYPFGMLQDFTTKYWILAIGILLMAGGILLFRRKR